MQPTTTIVVVGSHVRMGLRERLSASVERELLDVGRAEVAAGRAESLSAWVNAALRRQAERPAGDGSPQA